MLEAMMSRRRIERPLASYLLRVKELRLETTTNRYELVDLRSGVTLEFESLAQLKFFLGNARTLRTRRRVRP